MNTSVNNLHLTPDASGTDGRLTVDDTVGGVQLSSSGWTDNTSYIVLDVQTASIMVTFDGSAPTTSNGHLIASGTSLEWSRATAKAAKMIRATGTSAAVHYSPFTV